MPPRRISANDELAPIQEIAVNPYSAYNSDNVNMLTRIVSGQKEKDFVVNGLDTFGNNRVNTEVLDSPIIDDDFETDINGWVASNFAWDSVTESAIAIIPSPETNIIATLQSITAPILSDLGFWFKIEFTLKNTPKTLHVTLGSETKTYDHPDSGTYTAYLQLNNENGQNEALRFTAILDDSDPYSNHLIYIDDVVLTKVINRAQDVEPIALPFDANNQASLDHENIPEHLLHPHESVKVTPGIAIKDEAVVNLLGANPTDTPVKILTYGNESSWIHGDPFEDSDFVGNTLIWTPTGWASSTFLNGDLAGQPNEPLEDGEIPGTYRKVAGDLSANDGGVVAQVKWAYICIYYSYFKNPDPNKAYVGLVREEHVNDPTYGEDYLILGKCRFIDKNTVDAIIYYPDRQDWEFIDATRVTYLHLSQLKHWLNRPLNVSLAMDLLAERIYNQKGVLFFNRHDEFLDWIGADTNTSGTEKYGVKAQGLSSSVTYSGTGQGPKDYYQWLHGMDDDNGYDLVAYVNETQTFWKSRIINTGVITGSTIQGAGTGYTNGSYPGIAFLDETDTATGAQATVTVSGGSITDVVITTPGTNHVKPPYLDVSGLGAGTGAKVRGDLTPDLNGYDLKILWEEITQKRFEIDWSEVNSGNWPAGSLPAEWSYWDNSAGTDITDYNDAGWAHGSGAFVSHQVAKDNWPNNFYAIWTLSEEGFSVVNPYNPTGRGVTPGPNPEETHEGRFLRADGKWKSAGALDLHFEVKGHVVPTDKLVQGVMARRSTLKSIHIFSDSDITSPSPNGLKIDILVTRGGVTKSIFQNSTYGAIWDNVVDSVQLETGLDVPELAGP